MPTNRAPAGRDPRARIEELVTQLRASGGRVTAARRALLAALVAADHHVTADDLASLVQAEVPEVHRSTIYRSLEALEAAAIVDHVHLGHGRAIFHLADDRHQHIVCERCEGVREIDPSLLATFAADVAREIGFSLDGHHFALVGLCRGCQPAEPDSPG
ncbi:MAG: Fur family transcriptional regulator [Acidimicrobiales bacterium]